MVKKGNAMSVTVLFEFGLRHSAETSQHCGLVQGDVIGLVALDFILRLVRGSMANVTFVIDVPFMHFDDFSTHPPASEFQLT
jgi:hypothetical protein